MMNRVNIMRPHISRMGTPTINAAIARARRQIELLQEYRTRLIADVVTGKLDVRAVARLPDEDSGGNPAEDCALEESGEGSGKHNLLQVVEV